MAVSRRNFLRRSVAAAVAFASAPISVFAAGRQIPQDSNVPHKSGSNSALEPGTVAHVPETPELKFARLAEISHDSFHAAIGSPFRVSGVSGHANPFWLTLTSVQELSPVASGNPASMAVAPPAALARSLETSGFSLVFWGGPLPMVRQETFFFEHADLGQFAMFIVPAGTQLYTAVINRLPTITMSPR